MNAAAQDDFPPDYDERVARVCNAAAMELRTCPGDLLVQLKVCCRYFESGEREGISHDALIDYLGVSAHSVLDRAGYSSEEAQCVMKGLTLINYDKQGKPQPPTSLPDNPPPPPEQTTFNL
jgi:hypothetical protein